MRSGEMARIYHERTSQGRGILPSPGVAGFQPMDEENRPRPVKRYPQAPVRPLPVDLAWTGAPAGATLSGRIQPAADPAVDLALLARLLFCSAGITRTAGPATDPIWFRAAPSAGNLHPVEVYPIAGDVTGLPAGLYHFAPDTFGLETLRTGDHRWALAEAVADPQVAASPLALVLTGVPWRTTWKYAERGWRHVYWDAGTLLANLLAVADGHGLPVQVRLGFVDTALGRLLGVDGVTEFPVAVVTVDRPTSSGPAGPAASPAGEATGEATPVAAAPVEFPLVTDVQRAGDLSTAEEVAAWRAGTVTGLPRTTQRTDEPAAVDSEPIESVILRRGSTRRMRRAAAPAELLHWALAVATRRLPADALGADASLLTQCIAVHAVQDLPPGLYDRSDGGMRLHRAAAESEVRRLSRRLCLDQQLGGDSAYTVFVCADLDRVLDGYGERGYRLAQLEAGVLAGRLQLAAFALNHGGTGLTFYDREVSDAFDTGAACLLAVSIGRPAYRASPGGPPGRPRRISR